MLDVFEEEFEGKQPVVDDKEATASFKRRREAYLKAATPIANLCWSGPTPPDVEPDVGPDVGVPSWPHLKRRLQFHNEQPVVEQPAVEQPVVEQPAVEQPVVEQPAVEQPAVELPAVELDDDDHIFDVSIPSFLQKTGYVRRENDFAKKFDPKHFQLVVKKGDCASTRVSIHEGPTLKDVIVTGTTLEILGEAFDVGALPLLNQNHVLSIQNFNVETQCHFFFRIKPATLHRGPDEGSHATVSTGQRKRWEEGGFHGYRPLLFPEEKSQPPTG